MNDAPRRRLLDRPEGTLSLLAEGCSIVGDVETPGALMCGGTVRGFGRIGGELSLGPTARWHGDIVARRAAIAGHIDGSITVSDRLEIAASAVIRGRVAARSIAMARGATIDGEITVTGNEPLLEFEEKRTAG
jgi:cytoskeletal protein CcmA (bactofilin family)